LVSAFLVTAVVLILSVYLRRQDMQGRQVFVAKESQYRKVESRIRRNV
jgi:hypothetical protein